MNGRDNYSPGGPTYAELSVTYVTLCQKSPEIEHHAEQPQASRSRESRWNSGDLAGRWVGYRIGLGVSRVNVKGPGNARADMRQDRGNERRSAEGQGSFNVQVVSNSA
ncbi:hypothetical protein CPC08DRAFT_726695 [Agrocybe pediades]|nr:hypothetical protein CPC08DRAFT_726695 [Agrocybe pediades]